MSPTPNCSQSQDLLERMLEGGVQREDLLPHLETCDECQRLFDLHGELRDALRLGPESAAAAADLPAMRRDVLRTLRSDPDANAHGRFGWLTAAFRAPAFAAAAAVLLLGAGFAAGYGGLPGMTSSDGGAASFADDITTVAASHQQFTETQNSPYVYSNVRVREIDPQSVALSFDVATHMELVRSKDDPLVAEVLAQSMTSPGPLGARLQAISLAPTMQPKVRDALVNALLHDPELAVRLKALERLGAQGSDDQVEQALLEVLKHEESVQMRLLAIDRLAAVQVAPDALARALELGRPEPGTAIEARAERYLSTTTRF